MKRFFRVALVLSAVGNVALLGAVAWVRSGGDIPFLSRSPAGVEDGAPTASRALPTDFAAAGSGSETAARPAGGPSSSSPSASGVATSDWEALYSSNPHTLAANLRAAGFSENLVRSVVDALLTARLKDLQREAYSQAAPYWKAGRPGASDPEARAKWRAAEREKQKILRDLFGEDALHAHDRDDLRHRYGPLPDDKLLAVQAIQSDYADLIAQTRDGFGSVMPWERDQRALLEAEKRRDLQALLTPGELELLDLHSSSTANSMRRELASFAPTEAEFRAIFEHRQAFDENYNLTAISGNQDAMRERAEAQKALNEQIKSTLGEARYADYERSRDRGYQAAYGVTQRLNLPAENALAVYQLQRDIEKRALDARGQPGQDASARTAALQALASEAAEKAAALLTPQGAEAYRNSGGAWLRNLERSATPPAARP